VSKVIPFAVEVLQEEAKSEQTSLILPVQATADSPVLLAPLAATPSIVIAAFEMVEGLFSSIPTFIGAQVDKVFDAALSADILTLTEIKDSPATKARALLLSTAAKRLPAKTLYPAIIRLHASLDGAAKEVGHVLCPLSEAGS
jgi:hypothetical protein